MENIIDHLEWRYAVKKFDDQKILPEEKVQKIKNAFNLTATSYGLQPIRLVVLKNKGLQQQLVQHSWDQQQVAQASHLLIFCTEIIIDNTYINGYFEKVKEVRGTSDEVLTPFKEAMISNFAGMNSEEIQQWAKNQAYLAMGNLLTICAVEKIDSCPMEGISPKGYDELLELNKQGLKTVLVMPIGYRAEDDMFSGFKKVRRELADSVITMIR